MRRVAVRTLAALLVAILPAAARAAPPTPDAAAAVLYDPASGQFLAARNARAHLPVASLVKLMTARLALEAATPTVALVPAAVTGLPETKVGLVPGQRVSMQILIQAMLIRSGNDAALTAAVALAGSEPAFAAEMNAAAATLGLRDTHYVDSTGLDAPGQYSSARDVALLAAADLELPGFAAAVDRSAVTMPDGTVYRTVNPFLAYYPGADGIKTGFTDDAMFCLAASARHAGRTLIAVVLGEPGWPAADADAAALLDWGFASDPAPVAAAPAAAPASSSAAASRSAAPAAPAGAPPRSADPPAPAAAAPAPQAGPPERHPPWAAVAAAALLVGLSVLWRRLRPPR